MSLPAGHEPIAAGDLDQMQGPIVEGGAFRTPVSSPCSVGMPLRPLSVPDSGTSALKAVQRFTRYMLHETSLLLELPSTPFQMSLASEMCRPLLVGSSRRNR